MSVKVHRVRNGVDGSEVPLGDYKALRDTGIIEDSIFGMVLNGLSQRKYVKVATVVKETFGIKHSSVSRRFICSSAGNLMKLKDTMKRILNIGKAVKVADGHAENFN